MSIAMFGMGTYCIRNISSCGLIRSAGILLSGTGARVGKIAGSGRLVRIVSRIRHGSGWIVNGRVFMLKSP